MTTLHVVKASDVRTVLSAAANQSAKSGLNQSAEVMRLKEAMETIAKIYKSIQGIQLQITFEPSALTLKSNTEVLHVPRLVVQIFALSSIPPKSITLVYYPSSLTRIHLRVSTEASQIDSDDIIQWTSMTDSWSITSHGPELDIDTHWSFLLSALCKAKLTTAVI